MSWYLTLVSAPLRARPNFTSAPYVVTSAVSSSGQKSFVAKVELVPQAVPPTLNLLRLPSTCDAPLDTSTIS